jgi:hypothetical protein
VTVLTTARAAPISARAGSRRAKGGDGLDLRRHRGGEEEGLPVLRAALDDAFHVGQEAHVEHPVHFVEHEDGEGVEAQFAGVEKIHQAADGGDDDVHAGAQVAALFAVADAAVDDGGAQVGEAAAIAEGGLHLGGEFAGGFEDDHARADGLVGAELRENGKGERGGLARAGLRRADQVASGEDNRDGAQLDGRGIGVAHGLHSAQHVGRQPEFSEWHALMSGPGAAKREAKEPEAEVLRSSRRKEAGPRVTWMGVADGSGGWGALSLTRRCFSGEATAAWG